MNFIDAHRLLKGFGGGPSLPFLLAMSGTHEPFDIYLKAAAAQRGFAAEARTLGFGRLQQWIRTEAVARETEVFLLFPWDLAGDLDWRTGLPADAGGDEILAAARQTGELLGARPSARLLYVPAPIPPVFADPGRTAGLRAELIHVAADAGAEVLPADVFSMSSLLASGCPIGGDNLGAVAECIVEAARGPASGPAKVLVTDMDNVLWGGVVAEDGADGIAHAPEGRGFRHFLYQTFLKRLRERGILIAAVSRNDEATVLGALDAAEMVLDRDDFVAVIASYNAKSSQIEQLADSLNLGLESFVFVDDNPVELAEVSTRLSEVTCRAFPDNDDDLAAFLDGFARLFASKQVTEEDRDRTEMYRHRLAGMVPSGKKGADITEYLKSLKMRLTLVDRSTGERGRVVQLINKTNQFNLNGRRWDDGEVGEVLQQGGRLWGASLSDRHGDHGEVIACLIDGDGTVESFVMSCRVFERRVEQAFVAVICGEERPPRRFRFQATERNLPARQFLDVLGLATDADGLVEFDCQAMASAQAAAVEIFEIAQA